MEVTTRVDLSGAQGLLQMPSTFMTHAQAGLQSAATYFVNAYGKVYPAQWSHRHTPEWTDRQRRYVMWAIRTGEIIVPYPRTQELAASWSTTLNGLTAIAGSTAGHARLVQGVRQATYHAITGWKNVAAAGLDESPRMYDLFKEHIGQWVG